MCGIAGMVGSLRTDRASLQSMNDTLRHRGPDGEGVFWSDDVGLAMRRLAIIDVAGGDQPIYNEDGSVCVVFNGEIYNFLDLRAELQSRGHHFATNSDTEVVVHAYEEYGVDCVERLWGMFAIALWDARERRLLLARDRLGKKPLVYYANSSGGLAFASELQSLLSHPSVPREINPRAIDDYLTYLYVPAPTTAYREVKKLSPGHRLVWQAGRITIEPYWNVRFSEKLRISEEEAVEQFGVLLRDAVRRRLIADVPLGAFLSGGMDSSSVVAEMAELSTAPVKTFSIGFGERDFDELRYAAQVAQRFGTDHHELVVEPRALDILPTLVRHYGEPYGDSSAIPTFYVAQLTRQHVTVALNGDGGDEVLAGYERHWGARIAARYDTIPRFVRHGLIRPLVPLVPEPRQRRAFLRRAKRFMAAAHLSPCSIATCTGWVPFPRRRSRPCTRTDSSKRWAAITPCTGCATRSLASRGWTLWTPCCAPTRCCICPKICWPKSTSPAWPTPSRRDRPSWTTAWSSSALPCLRATSCTDGPPSGCFGS